MYCSKCGKEIKDDKECGYCYHCGSFVLPAQRWYPEKAMSNKAQSALIGTYLGLGIHFPLSIFAEAYLFELTNGAIFLVLLLIQFVSLWFGVKALVYEWKRVGFSLSFFFILLTLIFLFYPLLLGDIGCIYFKLTTWGENQLFFKG